MNLLSQQPTSHKSAKRLAELAAQLAKQSSELIELASALLADPPEANPVEVRKPGKDSEAPTPARHHRRPPASKTEVIASVKQAREVIGLQNRPVPIGTLFKEISARGCIIDTPKPVLADSWRSRPS